MPRWQDVAGGRGLRGSLGHGGTPRPPDAPRDVTPGGPPVGPVGRQGRGSGGPRLLVTDEGGRGAEAAGRRRLVAVAGVVQGQLGEITH